MHNYLTQSSKDIYLKPRATALLNRLKQRTWDKTGDVKLEGEHIPQSNISNMIFGCIEGKKEL